LHKARLKGGVQFIFLRLSKFTLKGWRYAVLRGLGRKKMNRMSKRGIFKNFLHEAQKIFENAPFRRVSTADARYKKIFMEMGCRERVG